MPPTTCMALCATFWQDSMTNFLVSEISWRLEGPLDSRFSYGIT